MCGLGWETLDGVVVDVGCGSVRIAERHCESRVLGGLRRAAFVPRGLYDSVNLVLVRPWARRIPRVASAGGLSNGLIGWGCVGCPWRRLRESLSDPVSLVPERVVVAARGRSCRVQGRL